MTTVSTMGTKDTKDTTEVVKTRYIWRHEIIRVEFCAGHLETTTFTRESAQYNFFFPLYIVPQSLNNRKIVPVMALHHACIIIAN